MQLDHYTTNFSKKKFPIVLVCNNVTNAPNIGSLFRTADAFGIDTLFLCGEKMHLGRKMAKTSRSTEKFVNYEIHESAITMVKKLKVKGFQIISLEITKTSQPINTFEFSKTHPIALLIGDENFGVSEALLNISDTTIHINMYGENSSMNVVQATSIALYEITKQLQL